MASAETALEQVRPAANTTPAHIWFTLFRHHLRLLAPSGIAWIVGLVLMAMLVAGAYAETMPTAADRQALAASVEGNPAFEAMFGKAVALDTIEGFTMWRAGGPLIPAIVIWGMLAATRLGRGDEDKGHDELILGGILTRQALLLSALAALGVVIGIYALLTTLMLPLVSEIGLRGSLRFALGMSGGFALFAALGALLVQLTPTRGVAARIGLAVVGATLALRVLSVIEQTPDWIRWLTPFGWYAELGTPDIGSDVPFLLFGIGTVLFSVTAMVLVRSREIHGSLLIADQDDAGPQAPYTSLWEHEFRQALPSLIGFAGVGLLLSTIFGLVANDFINFIDDFPAFAQILEGFGLSDPTNPSAFIGLMVSILVLIPTLLAASHVSAIREDEASGRMAVLLVLALQRQRLLLVSTVVGIVSVAVVCLTMGLGAMIGTGITGTMLSPYDALRAGLNLIPIAVLFIGLGIFIFGIYPRLTGPLVYGVMLSTFLIVLMDAFLDIPGWLVTLSPFDHLAMVPGEAANLTVAGLYLLVGIAGTVIGILLFRRRDLMMD